MVSFSGPGGSGLTPFIHHTNDITGVLSSVSGEVVGPFSKGDVLDNAVGYGWHLVNDYGDSNQNSPSQTCPKSFRANDGSLPSWDGCWMGSAAQYGTVRLAGRIGGAGRVYHEANYDVKVVAIMQVSPTTSAGANAEGVSMGWDIAGKIDDADDFSTFGEAGVLAWAAAR